LDVDEVFGRLGLHVLERGWLSSNNIVFASHGRAPRTVVDSGYETHSAQTLQLVQSALGGAVVERLLNTHLHSDHCGGNRVLQQAFGCEVLVPAASFDAARHWDAERLTFNATDQRCSRFDVDGSLEPGQTITLGRADWRVVAAPGHDPEAVMFFQPETGVLISADALWEERLAIIFPELDGQDGFGPTRDALHLIEQLRPRLVIPGHGRPFADVASALAHSRRRLEQFERDPRKHWRYAMRALVMFHLMERRQRPHEELLDWMVTAPVFRRAHAETASVGGDPRDTATEVVERLLAEGILHRDPEGSICA